MINILKIIYLKIVCFCLQHGAILKMIYAKQQLLIVNHSKYILTNSIQLFVENHILILINIFF